MEPIQAQERTRESLARLGAALWNDTESAARAVTESYAAVRLLKLADASELERAAQALLLRAEHEGARGFSNALYANAHPLFRLAPSARALLVGAHLLQWSYDRLARVLGETPEEAEAALWRARLEFGGALQLAGRAVVYPAANPPRSLKCPDSPSGRPWFQRVLDEETHGAALLFTQNHLQECDSCRHTFLRAKDFFYILDRELHALMHSPAKSLERGQVGLALDRTRRALRKTESVLGGSGLASVRAWLRKRDVRLVLGGLVAWCVWGWLR